MKLKNIGGKQMGLERFLSAAAAMFCAVCAAGAEYDLAAYVWPAY